MTARLIFAALLTAALILSPLASANSLDRLKQSAGGFMNSASSSQNTGGAGSLLGHLASGSLDLGSMQNVAGVLGYCQKQGYTESATQRVKDSLMKKLGGPSQTQDSKSYNQGLNGVLQGGQGQSFNLTNLKDQVGKRVCNAITDRAMSTFLGR